MSRRPKYNKSTRAPSERMWPRVDKSGDCWVWTGAKTTRGYGRIGDTKARGGYRFTHRVSYEEAFGPIPGDMRVLHKCDNPPCVRPDHLYLGDHGKNMQDVRERGNTAGLKNGMGKFTNREVEAMRKLVQSGVRQSVVADAFGCARSYVCMIIGGQLRASKEEV